MRDHPPKPCPEVTKKAQRAVNDETEAAQDRLDPNRPKDGFWAVSRMMDGHSVRRKASPKVTFSYLDKGIVICSDPNGYGGGGTPISDWMQKSIMRATDWETAPPPHRHQ